mmetsp:Transcript_20442/g.47953  ORF Transcript_20442/g.47953 Transcript_20442/m.47953 type:complete len:488 (+) Transcript_20442:412-1875(+)
MEPNRIGLRFALDGHRSLLDERHILRKVHLARNVRRNVLSVIRRDPGGNPGLDRFLDHRHRYLVRNAADLGNVGEDKALRSLFGGEALGKGLRRKVQHSVRDPLGPAEGGSEAETGENVHVVALGNIEDPSVTNVYRIEWRARGKHQVSVGPLVSVGGGTLGLDRGVGQRKDDGLVDVARHLLNEVFRKDATDGRDPEQNRGFEFAYHIDQGKIVVGISCKDALLGIELVGSIRSEQSFVVANEKGVLCHFLAVPLFQHGLVKDLRNPDPGTTRPGNQDSLVAEGVDVRSLGAEGSEKAGECRGAGSLDVVVEAEVIVSVLVEQPLCYGAVKVFELDQDVGPAIPDRVHELIDQVIVFLSTKSLLGDTNVEFVVQEFLVVGTDVEHHGEYTMRWDATGGTIQREFPDRNSHTIRSEIPQSENAASVRHDNDPYIFLGPVVHHRCHQSPVLFGKVHSPGSTKSQTHFLAGLSDRGSVNQGSHFFDVVD